MSISTSVLLKENNNEMNSHLHDNYDLDVSHYSIHELLLLFSLDDDANKESIIDATNKSIEEAKTRNQLDIFKFYINAQHKLFHSYNIDDKLAHQFQEKLDSEMNTGDLVGEKYNYNIISKPGPDYTEANNPSRYDVEFIQGDKNPVYQNSYNSLINIDSSFRETSWESKFSCRSDGNTSSSTNFLSTLTFSVSNVIEYSVYSIEIPYSWYFFSKSYGNTIFMVDDITITLPDGNYTITNLLTVLNNLLSFNSINIELSLNTTINKISMKNTGTTDYTIIFYDVTKPIFKTSLANVNLGWNLGYKEVGQKVRLNLQNTTSITFNNTYYIYGPKYLLLKVNDFAHNRGPNNLIGTMHKDTKCDYPSYLSRDLKSVQTGDNATSFQIEDNELPKRLTKTKLYTINAILQNRKTNTSPIKTSIDNSNDILIKIPIPNQETILNSPNKIFSETGGFLQTFKRQFFGKINLFKIHTQLLDDKGRIIDINGQDWSYTLLVKHIYQF